MFISFWLSGEIMTGSGTKNAEIRQPMMRRKNTQEKPYAQSH
jgi:hypothetical protein